MLAVIAMVAGGAVMPFQTAMNSRLRAAVASPLQSSLSSFSTGTAFLAVLCLLLYGRLGFPLSAVAGQPWWIFSGGALGVVALTTIIFVFPYLGGVQSVILPIIGQMIAGVAIDYWGLFFAPQVPLTPLRILGTAAVAAGVVVAVLAGNRAVGGSGSGPGPGAVLWQAAAVLSGMIIATQAAINGYLGTVIGSGFQAALVSFASGSVILLLICLIRRYPWRVSVPAGHSSNPWWMWTGGPLGAIFISCNALFVPILGAGTTVMASQTGMISSSLLIDKWGLLQAGRRPVTGAQLLGIAIMVAGVVLARL